METVCFQPPLAKRVLPVCVLCLWCWSASLPTCAGVVVQCTVSFGCFWFGDSLFSTTPSKLCTACLCRSASLLTCPGAVVQYAVTLVSFWLGDRLSVFNHPQQGKRCLSLYSVNGIGVQVGRPVPELWCSVLCVWAVSGLETVCFQPPLAKRVLPVCVFCLWCRSASLPTCAGAVVQCTVSFGCFWFGDSLSVFNHP